MIKIIHKLGGYKKVIGILSAENIHKNYGTLVLQSYRNSLSKDVSLILYDFCLKNNIEVSPKDFIEQRVSS